MDLLNLYYHLELEMSKVIFQKIRSLVLKYYYSKFDCKKISNSGYIVETVKLCNMSPHCDLDLEDPKTVFCVTLWFIVMHHYTTLMCVRKISSSQIFNEIRDLHFYFDREHINPLFSFLFFSFLSAFEIVLIYHRISLKHVVVKVLFSFFFLLLFFLSLPLLYEPLMRT